MEVRVGLCGFSMAMREYARRFPVVEVQNTFYEPPPDDVLAKWKATTGPALEYTMKVWQLVTHAANSPTYRRMQRKLAPDDAPGAFRATAAVDEGWRRSVECAKVLSATALLFQCPASFGPSADNVDKLRRFFERIERPPARLLWEPRGSAWVAARDLARAICRDLDLVHVVDPFVTPPAADGGVYWRLHGIGSMRHSYGDAELEQLARMLSDAAPVRPAYVLFNNLPRVGDAARFLERLTGVESRPPRIAPSQRSRRPAT
jgi:uncharacterized protein YecE (DUF72 family)